MNDSEGTRPDEEQAMSASKRLEANADRTDRQALLMATVVFLITFASWGSAQFACNRRPPQYKDPAAATTEQLASTPKDAAIELRQRELSGDLSGALELADNALAEELKPKVQQCSADPGSCAVAPKDTLFTKAEVLRYDGGAAYVRTISSFGGQTKINELRLERRGTIWKAVSREKAE